MTHPTTAHLDPPDLEHVPTVVELARMGLARVVVSGKTAETSTYNVTAEGHALVHEVMKRNAERAKAHRAL